MGLDYRKLTPAAIVDMFITDCTLPSTRNKYAFGEIYPVFKAYCEQINVGVPMEDRTFGRFLKLRFQSVRIKGYTHYFLEWRPGIFDV